MKFIRRLVSSLLFSLQSTSFFRRLMHMVFREFIISEADAEGRKKVGEWFKLSEAEKMKLGGPSITSLVAMKWGLILGYVELFRDQDHLEYSGIWLRRLLVKPFFRGMGVGESLSIEVLDRAKSEGAQAVYLLVKINNIRAIALYQKLGFVFVTPDYMNINPEEQKFEDGDPVTTMIYKWGPSISIGNNRVSEKL